MKYFKKTLVLLLVLAMVCSIFVGCAPSQTSASQGTTNTGAKKDIKIGVTIPTVSTPWCQELVRGGNKAVADFNKANGANVTITFLDNNRDTQKESANMEDLITQKVDAIIMIANDPKTSTLALETALASKIPVVIVDSPCDGSDKANAVIVSDNKELGRLEMEMLAKGMGGKGNLIVFEDSTNTNSKLRVEGRDEELKKYPNIKIVDKNDAPYDVAKTLEIMQNFMQSHPNQIDGIWCFSDTPAQGVIAAISGTPMEKQIKVTGLNGSDIAKGLIGEGKMFGSAAQFPVELITRGVLTCVDLVNGKKPAQQKILVNGAWISKENLASYPPTTTTAPSK